MKQYAAIFLALLLSGCGFHFRQQSSLPPALHRIALQADDPYNPFITQFEKLLTGLDVKIYPSAPIALQFSSLEFTHNEPKLSSTTKAINFTYTLNANVTIINQKSSVALAKKSFTVYTNQLMNANQIFTTNTNVLAQTALRQQLRTLIFEWLASPSIKKSLTRISPHGNHTRPIKK